RSVRRVLTLAHHNGDVDGRPLQVTFPAGWHSPGELRVEPDPDGGFHIAAARGGAVGTLESPPVLVPRGRRMILTIPVDTMASVVAGHGRYGVLSSPVQGVFEVDRTHAFFNYGPLYFYVAAALTWLMGPSLKLYRMLHPLGLVLVVLIAVWAMRRVSMVGPSL